MTDSDERTQAYGRLKTRVAALDMTMARFAAHVGTTASKASLWRSRGIPGSVLHALDTLERTKVASAVWTGRKGSAPRVVDAMDAMGRPFGAVIDDAVAAGWSRKRIAEVMRRLADDLDWVASQETRPLRSPGEALSIPAGSGPFLADLMETWDQDRPSVDLPGADVPQQPWIETMLDLCMEPDPPPVRRPVGFARDMAGPDAADDGASVSRSLVDRSSLEADALIADLLDSIMEDA